MYCIEWNVLHSLTWDHCLREGPEMVSAVGETLSLSLCLTLLTTDHWWGRQVTQSGDTGGHWGTRGDWWALVRPGDITACILILIQGPTPPHQHTVVPINIHINTYVISTHIHQYINTEQMTKKAIVHPDVFISFDVQCFNGILLVILLLHIHCVNHMILSLTMKLRNSE